MSLNSVTRGFHADFNTATKHRMPNLFAIKNALLSFFNPAAVITDHQRSNNINDELAIICLSIAGQYDPANLDPKGITIYSNSSEKFALKIEPDTKDSTIHQLVSYRISKDGAIKHGTKEVIKQGVQSSHKGECDFIGKCVEEYGKLQSPQTRKIRDAENTYQRAINKDMQQAQKTFGIRSAQQSQISQSPEQDLENKLRLVITDPDILKSTLSFLILDNNKELLTSNTRIVLEDVIKQKNLDNAKKTAKEKLDPIFAKFNNINDNIKKKAENLVYNGAMQALFHSALKSSVDDEKLQDILQNNTTFKVNQEQQALITATNQTLTKIFHAGTRQSDSFAQKIVAAQNDFKRHITVEENNTASTQPGQSRSTNPDTDNSHTNNISAPSSHTSYGTGGFHPSSNLFLASV